MRCGAKMAQMGGGDRRARARVGSGAPVSRMSVSASGEASSPPPAHTSNCPSVAATQPLRGEGRGGRAAKEEFSSRSTNSPPRASLLSCSIARRRSCCSGDSLSEDSTGCSVSESLDVVESESPHPREMRPAQTAAISPSRRQCDPVMGKYFRAKMWDAYSSRRCPGCGGARFTCFLIGDVGRRRRASLLQSVVASGRLNRAVLRRSRGELALVAVVRRRRRLLVVVPRKGWRKLAGCSVKNTYQQSQRYDWAWYTTGQARLGHRPSALVGYQGRSVSRDRQRISVLCKANSFSPHTQVHGQRPVTASRVFGHVRSCGVC